MTDNWDFYALRVDGEPASIFVDLGIGASAPLSTHPHMAYVRLYMNQPRPDGLSSREEFETLNEIEKAIEANLCDEGIGYVGRNTSGGCRDFYFYAVSDTDWERKVHAVLSSFKEYKYETGSREDGAWSTYFKFLMPSDLDRQKIENRRVCEVLERHGDELTAQREIDHWCYFHNSEIVDEFITEVSMHGFQVRNRPIREEGTLRFGVQIWRIDIPSYSNIDAVTLPLFESALRYDGQYDGWECPVEA